MKIETTIFIKFMIKINYNHTPKADGYFPFRIGKI